MKPATISMLSGSGYVAPTLLAAKPATPSPALPSSFAIPVVSSVIVKTVALVTTAESISPTTNVPPVAELSPSISQVNFVQSSWALISAPPDPPSIVSKFVPVSVIVLAVSLYAAAVIVLVGGAPSTSRAALSARLFGLEGTVVEVATFP